MVIFQLSYGESGITNVLSVLMEKKRTTCKNRQVIQAKRQKRTEKQGRGMLKMKSTLTEMKTAFDRLISRLDMVKERIGELEKPSQKLPKLKLKITQEL